MNGTWLLSGLVIGVVLGALGNVALLAFVVRPLVARNDDISFGLLAALRGGRASTPSSTYESIGGAAGYPGAPAPFPPEEPTPDDGGSSVPQMPSLHQLWREVKTK
jgi:hypothetical protein